MDIWSLVKLNSPQLESIHHSSAVVWVLPPCPHYSHNDVSLWLLFELQFYCLFPRPHIFCVHILKVFLCLCAYHTALPHLIVGHYIPFLMFSFKLSSPLYSVPWKRCSHPTVSSESLFSTPWSTKKIPQSATNSYCQYRCWPTGSHNHSPSFFSMRGLRKTLSDFPCPWAHRDLLIHQKPLLIVTLVPMWMNSKNQ